MQVCTGRDPLIVKDFDFKHAAQMMCAKVDTGAAQ